MWKRPARPMRPCWAWRRGTGGSSWPTQRWSSNRRRRRACSAWPSPRTISTRHGQCCSAADLDPMMAGSIPAQAMAFGWTWSRPTRTLRRKPPADAVEALDHVVIRTAESGTRRRPLWRAAGPGFPPRPDQSPVGIAPVVLSVWRRGGGDQRRPRGDPVRRAGPDHRPGLARSRSPRGPRPHRGGRFRRLRGARRPQAWHGGFHRSVRRRRRPGAGHRATASGSHRSSLTFESAAD